MNIGRTGVGIGPCEDEFTCAGLRKVVTPADDTRKSRLPFSLEFDVRTENDGVGDRTGVVCKLQSCLSVDRQYRAPRCYREPEWNFHE